MVRQAFERGALGYVPKTASSQTLLAALRLVLSGEAFVPARLLLDGAATAAPGRALASGGMTTRQADVLGCLAQGLSNKAIASSETTGDEHEVL